ncbi:MAG: DHA2 family efflux MFS transporter permease subunit [Pseudomonadales bacterium]|nr:DHA2 family efflux MFS transporter permease subunit [Pseudomonadales bacterium]
MSDRLESYIATLNTTDTIKALFRQHGERYGWIAMFTAMLITLTSFLTATSINVALPQIMGAFGIGQDEAQWLSTANLAASTVGMLLFAWVQGEFGLRKLVTAVIVTFFLASVVGGLSPNLEVMIFARIVQGLCAGFVTPLSISLVFQLFPANRQGFAMGITSIGTMLAPALGPTIGGLMVETFNWRYVFYLGIPPMIISLPMAIVFLPERDGEKPNNPFDWTGLILLSTAIVALLVGISNGEKEGWGSTYIITLLMTALVAMIGFIFWELRQSSPLLDIKIFMSKRFSILALSAFVFGAGLFGSTFLIPLFLQVIQGLSPIDAGLAMMPAGFVLALVAPFVGRMVDKFPPYNLIGLGIIFFAISFALMVQADTNTSFWSFAWWLIIGRIGIGLAMPTMNISAVRAVDPAFMMQAAGVINFIRQLGGAFGVNILSVVLYRRTQFHVSTVNSTQDPTNTTTLETLAILQEQLLGSGISAIEGQAVALQHLATSLHIQAVAVAFKDSFIVSTVVFLVALLPVIYLRKVWLEHEAIQKRVVPQT